MVEVTVDGKKVGFKKVKTLAKKARAAGGRLIEKAKKARSAEVQLAKIKSKQEILTAKAKLRQQRLGLAKQKAELRTQQLRAGGLNVSKFAAGARDLGQFATGGAGGIGAGFAAIGGTPRQAAPTPRTIRTVTRRVRIKSGKRKGKFKTVKKRVRAAVAQPKAFDPFSQF